MTVRLSPELEKLIQEKVRAGIYSSPEEMVQAGISRLLQDREEFEPGELDALVELGLKELDAGKGIDAAGVFNDLGERSRNARAGQQS